MVNPAVSAALSKLWTDRCTIYQSTAVTDSTTHMTTMQESVLVSNLACKLSFETLKAAGGDEVPTVQQCAKLFLSPSVTVPDGAKIVVTRGSKTFTFCRSGEPGVFSNHQEIALVGFRRYA